MGRDFVLVDAAFFCSAAAASSSTSTPGVRRNGLRIGMAWRHLGQQDWQGGDGGVRGGEEGSCTQT